MRCSDRYSNRQLSFTKFQLDHSTQVWWKVALPASISVKFSSITANKVIIGFANTKFLFPMSIFWFSNLSDWNIFVSIKNTVKISFRKLVLGFLSKFVPFFKRFFHQNCGSFFYSWATETLNSDWLGCFSLFSSFGLFSRFLLRRRYVGAPVLLGPIRWTVGNHTCLCSAESCFLLCSYDCSAHTMLNSH